MCRRSGERLRFRAWCRLLRRCNAAPFAQLPHVELYDGRVAGLCREKLPVDSKRQSILGHSMAVTAHSPPRCASRPLRPREVPLRDRRPLRVPWASRPRRLSRDNKEHGVSMTRSLIEDGARFPELCRHGDADTFWPEQLRPELLQALRESRRPLTFAARRLRPQLLFHRPPHGRSPALARRAPEGVETCRVKCGGCKPGRFGHASSQAPSIARSSEEEIREEP